MDYVILDLEWNQAADKSAEDGRIPFEIIEIGAVKTDSRGRVLDEFSTLIRPQVYPELFYRVEEVVRISPGELESRGKTFAQAMEEFVSWCKEDCMFCTWGSMDLTEFQKNIAYYNIKNPFPFPFYYYDIQKLYSIQYGDGKSRCSLETAIREMGLVLDQPFHRALSDAWYTALVMNCLRMQTLKKMVSVDYFRVPSTQSEEIYLVFDGYSKFVSKTYPSREEAMKARNVTSMVCYRCGHNVRRRLSWFTDQSRHYYALAYCPQHGWLKGKIRAKKVPGSDMIFMVKTLKLVNQEEAAKILVRHEQMRQKRREKRMIKAETEE